jgi:hypothetical protein
MLGSVPANAITSKNDARARKTSQFSLLNGQNGEKMVGTLPFDGLLRVTFLGEQGQQTVKSIPIGPEQFDSFKTETSSLFRSAVIVHY